MTLICPRGEGSWWTWRDRVLTIPRSPLDPESWASCPTLSSLCPHIHTSEGSWGLIEAKGGKTLKMMDACPFSNHRLWLLGAPKPFRGPSSGPSSHTLF